MKKVTILAAIHGDEVYGIELFNKFIKSYPKLAVHVQLIIGNELAYKQQKRYIDSDMNRHYSDQERDHESTEMQRVSEQLNYFKPDYIIDVHTTKRDSGVFFISDLPNNKRRAIYNSLPVDVCIMKDKVINKSFIGNHINAVSLEYSLNSISAESTSQFIKAIYTLVTNDILNSESSASMYDVTKLIGKAEWESYPGLRNYEIKHQGVALMVPANISEVDTEYYGFWCKPRN